MRKLFRNARIYTPVDHGAPSAGDRQGEIRVIPKGAIVCKNGRIEAVGEEHQVIRGLSPATVDMEVDCRGLCLTPGLVDAHTHMCFLGSREREFVLRLQGVDYLEILRGGGGILHSVRSVRAASEEDLFTATRRLALSAMRSGTTTLEIKSGYGLETETELKMLRVIERVGRETPLDVVPTFMGAHAIPEEYAQAPEEYVDHVVSEMIPAVGRQGIARYCDVFCERSVFSVEQGRRILEAARKVGLEVKIHADEVHDLGGSALAAEMHATSAEHLLAASAEGLQAMARAGIVAVLLPCAAYSLRKPYASARRMVELGLPIALATDCNPGTSFTESMPFVFGLAVLNMRMSVEEALVAATLNSAYAIGMAGSVGSLDPGKYADFLLLDGDSPAIMAYHVGVSPVAGVCKRGEPVGGNWGRET